MQLLFERKFKALDKFYSNFIYNFSQNIQKITKKCHFNTNLLTILFFFKKTLEIPCLKRYISCETLIC